MRRYLLVFILLLICSGCASEAERKMAAVQKDFETIQASDRSQYPDWERLKTSYEDLQTRLAQLSSSSESDVRQKADALLLVVKNRLATVYEEIDYKRVSEAEEQLGSAASYGDAIQQHQNLLVQYSNFEKKYPFSSKPVAAGKQRINSSLESIYNEKFEYEQLSTRFKDSYTFEEASAGLGEIDAFRQKHPNSIMTANLNQVSDGMREVKAKLWARDIRSISSLNVAIQEVNKLKGEAVSSGSQNFMQSVIASLEEKRSEIFNIEIAEKGSSLTNSMRIAAIESAKKQHPICGTSKDPASVVGEQRSVMGTRIEISRSYVVRTSGDAFCSSTYLVRVDVVGYLNGDQNSGLDYGIASSSMIVDARSPY